MLEAFQSSKSLILAAYPQLANSELTGIKNSLQIYSINTKASHNLETRGWYSIEPEGFYSVRIRFPKQIGINLEGEKTKLKEELGNDYSVEAHQNPGSLSLVAISGDYRCSFDVMTRVLFQNPRYYDQQYLPRGEVTKFKLQIFIERELQILRDTLGAEPDALFLILASKRLP